MVHRMDRGQRFWILPAAFRSKSARFCSPVTSPERRNPSRLAPGKGDCVGVISCDLQEPHEQFVTMLRAWEQGAQFVLGERVERAENWLHRTISGCYWHLLRRFAFADYPPWASISVFWIARSSMKSIRSTKKIPPSLRSFTGWAMRPIGSRSSRAAHEGDVAMDVWGN